MFQVQKNGTRRSTSMNKIVLNRFNVIQSVPKKYLSISKVLKRIVTGKLCQYMGQIHKASERKNKIKRQLQRIFIISKNNLKRRGINSLKVWTHNRNKKLQSSNVIKIILKNSIFRMNTQTYKNLFNGQYVQNSRNILTINLIQLQRFISRKILNINKTSLKKIIHHSKVKQININKMVSIISNKIYKNKIYSYLKLFLNNTHQKNFRLQNQSPTNQSRKNQSQEYIKSDDMIESEDKDKNSKFLNSYKSQKQIQKINNNQSGGFSSSKRSLSRKSAVGSLFDDDDFQNILTEYYSSKGNNSNNTLNQKIDHYKNLAKNYKKQLSIVKSQLQVTKEINEMISEEMDEMKDQKYNVQIKKLKLEVLNLEKDKTKYQQRSKKYQKQLENMKEQFKNRLQNLQYRVKKQL